jgi:hypothetical protein
MKKLSYLIVLTLILGLVLTGCSLLSNISQVPTTEQSGINYLTKQGSDPDPSLVGLWHFDEDTGITAYDSSGNPNDGTIYGAEWVDGKFSKALFFDGEDDYVEVADHPSLRVQELTIEAWVNLDTLPGRQIIIRKSINLAWGSFSLQVEKDGHLRLTVQDETNVIWPVWRTTSPLDAGGWYHVAGTFKKQNYDSSDGKIYVNGVAQTTTFAANGYTTGFMIEYTTGGFFIGMQHGQSYPLNGTIDEVRIWNRALTGDEIADNYKNLFMDVEIDIKPGSYPNSINLGIKPGSYPNSINLGSNGVVPVAILGSADFDAATVNPSTVTLSGAAVKLKGKSGKSGSLEDVNGDGQLDLVVQIYTDQLAPSTGETTAVLHAYTYTGLPFFTGSDVIRIVPPE